MKIPSRFPGAEETIRKRLRGRTLSLRLSLCGFCSYQSAFVYIPCPSCQLGGLMFIYFPQVITWQKIEEDSLLLAFEFQKSRPKYKKKDVEECMMIEDLADVAYLGKISWTQGSRESQVKEVEMLVHLYFSGTLHLT